MCRKRIRGERVDHDGAGIGKKRRTGREEGERKEGGRASGEREWLREMVLESDYQALKKREGIPCFLTEKNVCTKVDVMI